MPCGRRNFCSRFVPCRARARIIFREAIFPIDKAAGLCYNRFDSAEIGAAPILAGFAALVKRKNFLDAIILGAIKHIMLNRKTQWNQSLRATRTEKAHYVKSMIRYIIAHDMIYHHMEQNENKTRTKREQRSRASAK